MRAYELVVVVRPTLKDAEKKKVLEAVKGWFGELKIKKEDDWGQKPLAYPIKKEVAGSYYLWMLESETGVPSDLEQRIIRHEDILRHLLVRTK